MSGITSSLFSFIYIFFFKKNKGKEIPFPHHFGPYGITFKNIPVASGLLLIVMDITLVRILRVLTFFKKKANINVAFP